MHRTSCLMDLIVVCSDVFARRIEMDCSGAEVLVTLRNLRKYINQLQMLIFHPKVPAD